MLLADREVSQQLTPNHLSILSQPYLLGRKASNLSLTDYDLNSSSSFTELLICIGMIVLSGNEFVVG